ncbi:hypothetical protein CVT26_006479 [Gymnopilus dilepis]|uniref:Mixed lineage kinase domain-containing protein n=1 Tax=Gymnopilus dilepis TaxID=231916 RepID=A0A409W6F8_9AGAR|nr:hypothetical protein CVT26_006479 [Gymnopilus dilepis]
MIESIVTDVLTLLQLVYETVKGIKANSASRGVLLARIESLKAIISTVHAPAEDSPVSSALLDIKETVSDISGTVVVHEKRGWAKKALKVSAEAGELERLDKRLVAGQEQLCLAIGAENVNQAVKVGCSRISTSSHFSHSPIPLLKQNAKEVDEIFATKSNSFREIIKAEFSKYENRLRKHRTELSTLCTKLERLYHDMEKYPESRRGVAPRAPALPDGMGIGLSTFIRLGGTIISMVQGAKSNREEALAIGRRVQVVLDVVEILDTELLSGKVRRCEVDALLHCLQTCAEVVSAQTEKGSVKQTVNVQADRVRLRELEKELSERILRLGIDLQLHLQKLENELILNVSNNFTRLENDVKEASKSASYKLSDSIGLVDEETQRLQWIVERAPFYARATVSQELQDFSHAPILVNRVDCSVNSTDVQLLTINKGITTIATSHLWRELYCAVGRVIQVYDFKTGEYRTEFGRHTGDVTVLGTSVDKSKLLSYGQDRTVKLWNTAKKEELTSISPIQRCSRLEVTAAPEYHIVMQNYVATEVFARTGGHARLYFHGDASFVLSADGSTMAVRATFGIPIISTPSMEIVRTIPWRDRPGRLALSSNGRYLYVRKNFSADNALFDLEDGSTLPPIQFDGSEVQEQLYTDSQSQQVRLIAGTKSCSLKIWDIATGSLYNVLSYPSTEKPSPINSISVAENSAFGTLVAALDSSGMVRLWDADTGACMSRLGMAMDYVPTDPDGSAAFFVMLSPNGYRMVVRREKLIAVCMLQSSTALGKPKEPSVQILNPILFASHASDKTHFETTRHSLSQTPHSMIEGIVTDVLTLLQIAYDTVKGVKANSATRNVLLARIESLRAIISTIQTPALDSPVLSALADIKETVQSIAETVGAHEKRGWAQKALKVSAEASELERLDQRLVAGQSQLCLAISAENVNQAIKNAQEITTVFSAKSKVLPEIITDKFDPYQTRIDRHRSELGSLVGKLEHMYPSMDRYESPMRTRPAPSPGIGIGSISTLLRIGGTIISLVQAAKDNREEALAIGRRVQVVLDVTETLNTDLMNRRVRRDEVDALMDCLQKCAEVVADQTAKGAMKRAVDVQSDKLKLQELDKELSECLVRLGIDLQLHQQVLDTELMFNVTTSISQLEQGVRQASDTSSDKISTSLKQAEEEVKRLQWIIDRAPFYSMSSSDQLRDFSEHMSFLVNRIDCSVTSPDIKPLSVNKGFTAVVVGRVWRELYLAVGRVLHVYGFESGEHQFEVGRHSGTITALAITSDESKLASFGQDRVIRVWDVMRRKELSTFSPIERCAAVDFTAGPEYHVATHNHTFTQVFSRYNPDSRIHYHGDAAYVISADGSTMAFRGMSGIAIAATSTMEVTRTIPWNGRPTRIALSGNGQYLCVRGNTTEGTTIFKLDDGAKLLVSPRDDSEVDEQFYIDSSAHEVRLIAGTRAGSIRIRNIHDGSLYKELSDLSTPKPLPIVSISVAEDSASGGLVASLDASGVVCIWHIGTSVCLSRLGVGLDIPLKNTSVGSTIRISTNGYRLLVKRGGFTAVCMLHGFVDAVVKMKAGLNK